GFRLAQQVGGGGFSSVFRAVNVEEHRIAACKVVLLTKETTPYQRKTLDKEMRVHTALKHQNVLEFINAVVVEPDKRPKYIPAIYMLLEFAAGGDLFDKIAPDIGLDEDTTHFFFLQLLEGLSFIHGEGVCHRDLKPENILLDITGKLKISDFGLCSVYKLKESGRTRMLTERCGSLPYVAPETRFQLDSEDPYQAEPIDVWGVGVILFTMLVGNTPWDEPTKRSYEYSRYITGKIFDDDPWKRIGKVTLSLLTRLLDVDPSTRITLAEAKQHPWVLRLSQIASQGPVALAEKLTRSLREQGDLELANPDLESRPLVDKDGDQVMLTATRSSQFTQSLLLFSQTQSGTRYTPQLTRFYARIQPPRLLELIEQSLVEFRVKVKHVDPDESSGSPDDMRCRIGGFDKRRVQFRGWVIVQRFVDRDIEGSFCIMQRDEGNPLSWRELWKAVVQSPRVERYVLKRR
ncbi:hypothetical protein HETIRDRAFT_331300, partial [Heterobasidion irregulare TC 32-1]